MSSNKKATDDEFTDRVNKLLSRDAYSSGESSRKTNDDELAQRFNKIFSSEPIATSKNISTSYYIPDHAYNDDIDKEIERMFQESDEEEDAIDDYIYSMLGQEKQHSIQEKMDAFQEAFVGSDGIHDTDESAALIRQLQEENALDAKYEQFTKKRDDDLEKRYLELKKDAPTSFSLHDSSNKPRGSIPKPIATEDLHDEMDDWCCICNDDATIECEGCEDDNKYCNECFFHTHRSESADYEATKHKSKRYVSRK